MPERFHLHLHLLMSEPQDRTPSAVMQALKLGFARRVLIWMRRRPMPPRPSSSISRALRSTSGKGASTTSMFGPAANSCGSPEQAAEKLLNDLQRTPSAAKAALML